MVKAVGASQTGVASTVVTTAATGIATTTARAKAKAAATATAIAIAIAIATAGTRSVIARNSKPGQ